MKMSGLHIYLLASIVVYGELHFSPVAYKIRESDSIKSNYVTNAMKDNNNNYEYNTIIKTNSITDDLMLQTLQMSNTYEMFNKNISMEKDLQNYNKLNYPSLLNLGKNSCPKPYCRCDRTSLTAICTGMHYIPRLPLYTLRVEMSLCNLGRLDETTFTNLTNLNLVALSLRNCQITEYTGNVFGRFLRLKRLDLSGNHVKWEHLRSVLTYLNNTNMSHLKLEDVGFNNYYNKSIFDAISGCNLTLLSLAHNKLLFFSGKMLKPLKLKTLDLNNNNISHLDLRGFNKINSLRISHNSMRHMPVFVKREKSLTPKLTELDLSNNKFVSFKSHNLNGLPNLEKLTMDDNFLYRIGDGLIKYTPNLKTLSLSRCRLKFLASNTFNSSSLQKLNLQFNQIHFLYGIHKYVFSNLPNLENLYLDYNPLDDLGENQFIAMFKPLKKLIRLNMAWCRLTRLPYDFTKTLPSLRSVMLTANKLVDWHNDTFAYAPNITHLYIGDNRIKLVNKTLFPPALLDTVKYLNLEGNPFSCTCDLMWFRNFLNHTKIHIKYIENLNAYKCAFPKFWEGKPLLSYKPTIESCTKHDVNLVLVLSASLGSFTVVLAICFSLLYKYRWHLKYWWFVVTAKMNKYQLLDGGMFRYDAFVSYSCRDREWVVLTLLPTIEEKGYRLCLHDRDFMPGRHVIDNIVEGIDASRRVILVLSDNFAQSEWCKWEVSLAQHKNLNEGNASLILLKYRDVQDMHMSKRLAAVIRERTYLEWREDTVGNRHFWQQLDAALASPLMVDPSV